MNLFDRNHFSDDLFVPWQVEEVGKPLAVMEINFLEQERKREKSLRGKIQISD